MSSQSETIGSVWKAAAKLIAVALPRWVISRFNARHDGHGFAVKAIPFVIIFLSLASVTNLAGRAHLHHDGISAYLTGAGIAVLVPLAVLAAMLIEGGWRYLFWAMAMAFAAISGTIQYNIYYIDNSWLSIAEAMAFGYGVPVSEVMLAIMEARLIVQMDRQKAMALTSAEAEKTMVVERQIAAEEANELREFERQKRQIEIEAMRAKAQQDAEIEREKALAAIRIKEAKASAKSVKADSVGDSGGDSGIKKAIDYERIVIDYFTDNPLAPQREAAQATGISQAKISKTLKDLESRKIIHRNGSGVEVLS